MRRQIAAAALPLLDEFSRDAIAGQLDSSADAVAI
jgi:hypothetical protein